MKKKYLFFISLLILFVVGLIFYNHFKVDNVYKEENLNNSNNINKGISMNLEQTAGAGDYKNVTQSEWPKEGYKFNSELSKCENGGEVTWDDVKKIVVMTGNISDKCYVYFDIIPSVILTEYIISQYTGVQGENDIYYHTGTLSNGAGDNSYRYSGAIPNNYVCFGSDETTCPEDNLYRIIGVIGGKVKLIKYDFANSNLLGTDGDYYGSEAPLATFYKGNLTTVNTYYWNYKATSNAKNTWSTSLLNKTNLNINFINNIGTTWASKIDVTTWKVGGNTETNIKKVVPAVSYQNEIVKPVTTNTTDKTTTYSARIGMPYVSDYTFAAIPDAWTLTLSTYDNSTAKDNNWMYMGFCMWTITRDSTNDYTAFYVGNYGSVNNLNVSGNYGVRPTFSLNNSVLYVGGDGSISSPIRIS